MLGIILGLAAQTYGATPVPLEPVILDADAVQGHVLPFKIIAAIRNLGFREGLVAGQVSVSVTGGVPADWMATGISVAEHSIVNGVTFAQVEVFVPNPDDDMPPTQNKRLAETYYAPDPPHSPWSDRWTIMGTAKAASPADIKFHKLGNDLLSDRISDPDRRMRAAEVEARRRVIAEYRLPKTWQPAMDVGLSGVVTARSHVAVVAGPDTDASFQALSDCLMGDGGGATMKVRDDITDTDVRSRGRRFCAVTGKEAHFMQGLSEDRSCHGYAGIIPLVILLAGCAGGVAPVDTFPLNDTAKRLGPLNATFVRTGTGEGPVTITMADGEILTGRYKVAFGTSQGFGFAGGMARTN